MKKYFLCTLFIFIIYSLFSQELKYNQILINGTIFTLGVNTYEEDYDLVFNRWYKGYQSVSDIKKGEPLEWVTKFTSNYNIKALLFDVTLDHAFLGQNNYGICFQGTTDNSIIVLIYNNSNKLAYVDFIYTNNVDRYKKIDLSIPQECRTLYNFKLVNNILFEPHYGFSVSQIYGFTISYLDSQTLETFKKNLDWIVNYEKQSGIDYKYPESEQELTGLCIVDSQIRINSEKEQEQALILQQEKKRLEQVKLEEDARFAVENEKVKKEDWIKRISDKKPMKLFVCGNLVVDNIGNSSDNTPSIVNERLATAVQMLSSLYTSNFSLAFTDKKIMLTENGKRAPINTKVTMYKDGAEVFSIIFGTPRWQNRVEVSKIIINPSPDFYSIFDVIKGTP